MPGPSVLQNRFFTPRTQQTPGQLDYVAVGLVPRFISLPVLIENKSRLRIGQALKPGGVLEAVARPGVPRLQETSVYLPLILFDPVPTSHRDPRDVEVLLLAGPAWPSRPSLQCIGTKCAGAASLPRANT